MRISLGDFVDARFAIPQNPIALNGMGELAVNPRFTMIANRDARQDQRQMRDAWGPARDLRQDRRGMIQDARQADLHARILKREDRREGRGRDWEPRYTASQTFPYRGVQGVDGVGGMGEFVPACFPIPQNPIGLSGLSGGCGGSCGCSSCEGGMEGLAGGIAGVVDDATDAVKGAWDSVAGSLGEDGQTYLLWGGVAVAAFFLMSRGSGYRGAASDLRREYQKKSARLKASYGRGYQRAGRSLSAARSAF